MKAIRKVLNVKKNAITVKGLESFNNKAVEVIIIPLNEDDKNTPPDKRKLTKFRGLGSSGYSDTSRNVDNLIYGR
jgi:hypothetical protein